MFCVLIKYAIGVWVHGKNLNSESYSDYHFSSLLSQGAKKNDLSLYTLRRTTVWSLQTKFNELKEEQGSTDHPSLPEGNSSIGNFYFPSRKFLNIGNFQLNLLNQHKHAWFWNKRNQLNELVLLNLLISTGIPTGNPTEDIQLDISHSCRHSSS